MSGQRNTRQRALVLKVVKAHRDHPSADEIYMDARAQDSKISRGTVYRNLNLLADSNLIRHINMPESDRFDWCIEPHYHLHCMGCAKIYDVPITYQTEWDKTLSVETGYEISFHRTIFEGLCPDCKRNKYDVSALKQT